MSVLIFANGVMEEVEWVRPYLAQATAVIAANGGSKHLYRLGHAPDVLIGDMDSLPPEVQAWCEAAHTRLLRYPAAKNETDLELALLLAVREFADDLLLFGALGGRLDQTLANILLLTHPALIGRQVTLVTARERAWLVWQKTKIDGRIGDVVSLVPVGGDVHVGETRGLAWPLQDEVLSFGLARGVSNELVAETAVIIVNNGFLLCIHTYE